MLLATTQVEDFDRFLEVFSTKGADKRRLHGSNGATVFRDPSEPDRIWAIFDWDAEGWKNFVSDPEVPAILQEAGHMGKPQATRANCLRELIVRLPSFSSKPTPPCLLPVFMSWPMWNGHSCALPTLDIHPRFICTVAMVPPKNCRVAGVPVRPWESFLLSTTSHRARR